MGILILTISESSMVHDSITKSQRQSFSPQAKSAHQSHSVHHVPPKEVHQQHHVAASALLEQQAFQGDQTLPKQAQLIFNNRMLLQLFAWPR